MLRNKMLRKQKKIRVERGRLKIIINKNSNLYIKNSFSWFYVKTVESKGTYFIIR